MRHHPKNNMPTFLINQRKNEWNTQSQHNQLFQLFCPSLEYIINIFTNGCVPLSGDILFHKLVYPHNSHQWSMDNLFSAHYILRGSIFSKRLFVFQTAICCLKCCLFHWWLLYWDVWEYTSCHALIKMSKEWNITLKL